MRPATIIHWFRQDLRLADNPAWVAATQTKLPILPIYILDDMNSGDHAMGAASRCWLHESLHALNRSLNNHLSVFRGDPLTIFLELLPSYDVKKIVWNRCYEPWQIARDKLLKKKLLELDIIVESYNGSLLWEPWEIVKADGTPYKVFTPFFQRGCLNAIPPRNPLPAIQPPQILTAPTAATTIADLKLLPSKQWHKTLLSHWQIGETAAYQKLHEFLTYRVQNYKEGRDFPALESVSGLSPHIHFGEISPQQIWYAVKAQKTNENTQHFLRELAWREFSYSLLYYFPNLPTENWQKKFNDFPWESDPHKLRAWQKGLTGYPFVDAGMRQLWQTGYLHNRVRMVVGSFLVKNLLQPWQAGERWFWDCLVDADLANNSASWQWVAGSGADAAPYFRIFNPVTQGQKFDPNGVYTRHYLPELTHLPDRYLFNPWEAPQSVLTQAGIILGKNYPYPLVDLKSSREKALQAYQKIK
ncbi:MAG: deoxyribodipyrimidine photo-lyase [Legionellales bacterium]|nr:deoxyribodipyrimidine photo-lyase [Legionellales bacterium]